MATKKSTNLANQVCRGCKKNFLAVPSWKQKYCSLPCFYKHRPPDSPLRDRFFSYVKKTRSCWLWTGAISRNGYGVLNIEHVVWNAHRVSWELAFGPIPDGFYVLHDCPTGDRKLCVNPAHLKLGTHNDNAKDSVKKDQIRHGERHPCAKLHARDIPRILRMRKRGLLFREIGKHFNVGWKAISKVVRGETWRRFSAPFRT